MLRLVGVNSAAQQSLGFTTWPPALVSVYGGLSASNFGEGGDEPARNTVKPGSLEGNHVPLLGPQRPSVDSLCLEGQVGTVSIHLLCAVTAVCVVA